MHANRAYWLRGLMPHQTREYIRPSDFREVKGVGIFADHPFASNEEEEEEQGGAQQKLEGKSQLAPQAVARHKQ